MAASPKFKMLPSHSQLSAGGKSLVHEAKDHSEVRSKIRKTLAAALSIDVLCSNLRPVTTVQVRDDMMQKQTQHVVSSAALDDNNLQGHGAPDSVVGPSESMAQPNPKRARMTPDVHAGIKPVSQTGPDQSSSAITTAETTEEKNVRIQKAQRLAFKIEDNLFKFFGGFNEKYKEKVLQLLHNLKDKNNPALRERVLSGDITPKCLCAMTIEELTSKELSDCRMAKAEDLVNIVVLLDRQVGVRRRLVRKTHKGDSQVEVEETDAMEVGSLSNAQAKSVDQKGVVHKESDNSVQDGVAETCNSNTSSNLEHSTNEKSDLMQGPMIHDVEFTESLPQIMTLLEFMQLLHSQPHSEDQSAGALQEDPSIDEADKALKSESSPIAKDKTAALKFQFHSDLGSPQANFESQLESAINKSVSIIDPVLEPNGDVIVKSPPEKVDAEKTDTVNGSIPESTMQCKITPDAVLQRDSIWEGTIQLGLNSPTNIVAIFKSGEKPSTNEWCRSLEIKERLSLSVLTEYLEQIAIFRNRAIMVIEICSKEGSLESGRHHPLQTIASYIAHRRGVGIVKAAEGVTIYLIPQGEAAKILADHLPKEHSGSFTVTETSIIGLVVWRRPDALPNVQPNRQDVPNSRPTVSCSVAPRISQPPSRCSKADADMPEYNSVSDSNSASDDATTSLQTNDGSQWHTSLSEFEIRELVRKYG